VRLPSRQCVSEGQALSSPQVGGGCRWTSPRVISRVVTVLAARSGPRFAACRLRESQPLLTCIIAIMQVGVRLEVTAPAPGSSPWRRTLDRRALNCGLGYVRVGCAVFRH
jgi:hypothetical protein